MQIHAHLLYHVIRGDNARFTNSKNDTSKAKLFFRIIDLPLVETEHVRNSPVILKNETSVYSVAAQQLRSCLQFFANQR